MNIFFGQNINLEQSQKLTLTPEMIQSLNILQFSTSDLLDFISETAEDNPVIELENGDIYLSEISDEENYYIDSDRDMSFDSVNPDDWDAEDWYDFSESMNSYSYEQYGSYGAYTIDLQDNYTEQYGYNAYGNISLEESLMEQVDLCNSKYITKAIASYIIQTLDEKGYLTQNKYEMEQELNVPLDQIEVALSLIHTFDPPGIGAADIKECLKLQLKRIDRYDDVMEKIIDEHLENIATNNISRITADTGIGINEANERLNLLRSLEPKPGRMFNSYEKTRFIIPDIEVENRDGTLTVSMNQRALPRISIRQEYDELIKGQDKNSTVANFLSTRFNSARWLIRSIEQRNNTILRVSKAIVDVQKEFFMHGKSALKPLNMKDIAADIGVHESTVSRAVNGKYLQCKQGVFELKYFFSGTGRFSGVNGAMASSEALKNLIKNIVDKEDRSTPLSDRSIAEAITLTGVEISRRTVTKYREEMGIPSSSLRRRVK